MPFALPRQTRLTASLRVCLLALAACGTMPAAAQFLPGQSEAPARQCQPPGTIPERGPIIRTGPLPMEIRAEDMGSDGPGTPMRFRDNVTLVYGDQRLDTDELIYDPDSGEVTLPGWLDYADAVVTMSAESARYNTVSSSGQFEQVRYFIAGQAGAGHAGRVEMLDPTRARVQRFDFTTCDIDRPAWQLKAGDVNLDFERNVGTARNARLIFKGVPILYSPWLTFPLNDERKSGLLYPRAGFSSDNGFDFAQPVYWNIAPNQDATFTPRIIGDRGFMLGSEYRFLKRRHGAELNFDYLPDDDEADRDRWLGRIRYRGRLAPNWSTQLNFNRASDQDYFLDLGDELEDSTVQFLRSDLRLTGRGRHWIARTTFDTFQVLDPDVLPGNEPFNRLPRIEFDAEWPLTRGLAFRLDSEAVYFDRSNSVTGLRLDTIPELAWRVVRPGWFVEPALALRATAWSLDDQPGEDSTPTRTQPIISFDSGLIFERQTASGRLQTLEPRLFYLFVPDRDQSDIPLFDTRELTFSFAQLYQTNRFSGADRQTDANQVSLAVTTRLLDDQTGRSLIDASIGQIVFFDDPDTGLRGRNEDSRTVSATVGEINWRPLDNFLVSAGLQYDPEDNETDVAAFGLRWQGQDARQVQLGYRFRRDRVDQIDIRGRYPLTRELNLIGRLDYSFEDSTALEVLGGLEYESCCWALRASVRRFVRDRESEKRTAFFLELHLKGLGSLGRRPYNLFTR